MTIVATVNVLGASFFSTHHASPEDVLAGRERPATQPAYPLLTGRARRFTSLVTQMHMEVCGALRVEGAEPPTTVFATCHGEIQTAGNLLADFHANAVVSSARFALSVHNTPSGLYSVATGSSAPSTTVTGDNAIAAGWLEAALTALDSNRTVLLSIADEPVPAQFEGPAATVGVAAAFLLSPASSSSGGHTIDLALIPNLNDVPVDPLHVLARAAAACVHRKAVAVVLGRIQTGALLELRG
ncbi:hypothetical protein BH11MYX3_BH11MYX3_01550 [soil metagenome]